MWIFRSSSGSCKTDLWLGDHGVAATIGRATGVEAATVQVATLVTLLASPRTANVTGANYVIDGGLVKTM